MKKQQATKKHQKPLKAKKKACSAAKACCCGCEKPQYLDIEQLSRLANLLLEAGRIVRTGVEGAIEAKSEAVNDNGSESSICRVPEKVITHVLEKSLPNLSRYDFSKLPRLDYRILDLNPPKVLFRISGNTGVVEFSEEFSITAESSEDFVKAFDEVLTQLKCCKMGFFMPVPTVDLTKVARPRPPSNPPPVPDLTKKPFRAKMPKPVKKAVAKEAPSFKGLEDGTPLGFVHERSAYAFSRRASKFLGVKYNARNRRWVYDFLVTPKKGVEPVELVFGSNGREGWPDRLVKRFDYMLGKHGGFKKKAL